MFELYALYIGCKIQRDAMERHMLKVHRLPSSFSNQFFIFLFSEG